MNKAVILLSGGLDSFVSLAYALKQQEVCLALTFDYGQRAADKEIEASKKIADFFNIEHKVIEISWLKEITQTSLVNQEEKLPELNSDQLDNPELTEKSAKGVWVPNRNGVFLNIAAAYADSYGYSHIVFGANKEEGTTFPDNTQEFIDKINSAFEFSTLQQPKVIAPLINFDKTAIVRAAIDLNVPLNLLRSCYTSEQKHCGKCESCLRLKRALEANGLNFESIN